MTILPEDLLRPSIDPCHICRAGSRRHVQSLNALAEVARTLARTDYASQATLHAAFSSAGIELTGLDLGTLLACVHRCAQFMARHPTTSACLSGKPQSGGVRRVDRPAAHC